MNSTSRQCEKLAGPFLHIHDGNNSCILWLVFSFLSIVLTCFTRRLVLGYVTRTPPTNPTPTLAVPTPCSRCQHIPDTDLPHPLAPLNELPPSAPLASPTPAKPSPTYQEILAADKKRLTVVPSIPRFILCTILTLANIVALVLAAFAIQAMLYCDTDVKRGKPVEKSEPQASAICLWFIYVVISIAWASCGILCWPIWVRNLCGGEDAAEKWPIWTEVVGMVLVGGVLGPPLLIFVLGFFVVTFILSTADFVIQFVWQKIRGKPMAGSQGDKSKLWQKIRAKWMAVAEGNEAERGLSYESSSSSATEVDSIVEK